MEHKAEFYFNVVCTGDSAHRVVAKMSEWSSESSLPIAMDFVTKSFTIEDDIPAKMAFWDMSGMERFPESPLSPYKKSHCVLLCYNPKEPKSLEKIKGIYEHKKEMIQEKIIFLVCTDFHENNETYYLAEVFAKENNIPFMFSYKEWMKKNTIFDHLQPMAEACFKAPDEYFKRHFAGWDNLTVASYEAAFKKGAEMYDQRNPTISAAISFFSLGSVSSGSRALNERMPVIHLDRECHFGLVSFLQGPGDVNFDSFKCCVLKSLFPKIEMDTIGKLQNSVDLIYNKLLQSNNYQQCYQTISIFAAVCSFGKENGIPFDISKLILNTYLEVTNMHFQDKTNDRFTQKPRQ